MSLNQFLVLTGSVIVIVSVALLVCWAFVQIFDHRPAHAIAALTSALILTASMVISIWSLR